MENAKNSCETVSNGAQSFVSQTDLSQQSSSKVNNIRNNYSNSQLQHYLLEGVSRTFALTIPELPEQLQQIVGNAYLLCRIVDTIEDSVMPREKKEHFARQFVEVVKGNDNPRAFARQIAGVLGPETTQAEHELIWLTASVIDVTHHFEPAQRRALERCVDIMAGGMVYFQENASIEGLPNLEQTNKYCYSVAGVVGEMLTELFCLHSPKIAHHRERLLELSVLFGRALQMTNILKDLWDDYQRSVCWFPQSVFKQFGFDLRDLPEGHTSARFQNGLEFLIGRTNHHLHKAMEYTLLIPPEETGIRRFCLWSLGMSALTLRKINSNKGFTDGEQVKISRNSVKGSIFLINLSVKHDHALNFLFKLATTGLPRYRG